MIKKNNLIKMTPLKSSNLKAIGFRKDQETNIIRIEFQRGSIYEYFPCRVEEYIEAISTDNVSGWFKDFIVGKSYMTI